jgi:hypothetical protein
MRSRRQTCRPIEPRIVYAHGPGESSPAIDRSCFGDRYTARHTEYATTRCEKPKAAVERCAVVPFARARQHAST